MNDAIPRGYRTGECCFTTLVWRNGLPATWPLHLQRLARDCHSLAMPLPDLAALPGLIAKEAAAVAGPARVRIDAVAIGGAWREPPLSTALLVTAQLAAQEQLQAPPLRLVTLANELATGDALAAVKRPDPRRRLRLERARDAGADDALVLCAQGHAVATAAAALVIGIGDRWLTAPESCGGVASTTVAWLAARDRRLQRAELTPDILANAEFALACNAVWGGRAVAAIDGRSLADPPREILQQLRAAVGALQS